MVQSLQQPQLSPDALQLATINYLGNAVTQYKYRYVFILIMSILLLLGSVFFLALLILAFAVPPTDGSQLQLILTFIVLTLVLAAAGIWLIMISNQHRNSSIYVFSEGLLRSNGKKTLVLRWDQVEAIWQAVTRRYYNGVYTGTTHQYTIRLFDGTKATFNDSIQNVEALGNTLAKETLRVLLPRVITAYNTGSIITFGPLSVSQQGVSNGKEILSWSQVKGIRVNKGIITVQKEGKWLSWSTVRVPRIPNFFVFMALIDYVTGQRK